MRACFAAFENRMKKCEEKLREATANEAELAKKKKETKGLVDYFKSVQAKTENRDKLKGLAEAITAEHHEAINRHFRTTAGNDTKGFFEHFVGLLRDIANAKQLDVMLYF